jgi:endogenous inhibitor of DNA gyrase (YacG/DUF329 family)
VSQRICTVPECGKPHRARGLCATHYNQTHQPERHAKVEVPCAQCGTPVQKHKTNTRRSFCDYTCRDLYGIENKVGAWSREAKPKVAAPKRDLRSPLRRALEDGDHAGLIAAIRECCDVRPSGCWEWQRSLDRHGYPTVNVGSTTHLVHRLVLEARLRKPLGKQPAHHACGNSFCVNPEHLQPVTAAANMAEMMARRYMQTRIKDLEAALAAVQPDHPLLTEVGVVSTT